MTTADDTFLARLNAVAPGLTLADLDDALELDDAARADLVAKYVDLGKIPSRDVAQEVVDVLKTVATYLPLALAIAQFFGL